MKYPQLYDGKWITPARKDFRIVCCGCGMAHRLNFRLIKRWRGKMIEFQMRADPRATAAARRGARYRRVAKALA